MNALDLQLDREDTWLCHHVDQSGAPAPATRLSLALTEELFTEVSRTSPRRWLRCPECAAFWRVWLQQRIARPSIERTPEMYAVPPLYQRAPVLDIDRIIRLVRHSISDLIVFQNSLPHLADDEGVWFFQRPTITGDIQLESSTGACPFLVEADPSVGVLKATVEDAAKSVVDFFRGAKGSGEGMAGVV